MARQVRITRTVTLTEVVDFNDYVNTNGDVTFEYIQDVETKFAGNELIEQIIEMLYEADEEKLDHTVKVEEVTE